MGPHFPHLHNSRIGPARSARGWRQVHHPLLLPDGCHGSAFAAHQKIAPDWPACTGCAARKARACSRLRAPPGALPGCHENAPRSGRVHVHIHPQGIDVHSTYRLALAMQHIFISWRAACAITLSRTKRPLT